MEQSDLIRHVCTALEQLGIPYLVTGSQATIVFGEPRFTNDIDIVVRLDQERLDAILESFPIQEFYWSHDAARDAVARRSMFSIIHPASGLKVDIIVSGDSEYERAQFARGRKVQVTDDFAATFSSPEDIILKKLQFYKIRQSDRHLRDIAGVLKISGGRLDYGYIDRFSDLLAVADIWRQVLQRVAGDHLPPGS